MSIRVVGSDELATWRKKLPRGWQRAVALRRPTRHSDAGVEAVWDDSAAFTVPDPKPQPSEVAYETVVNLLIDAAKRSRVDFRKALAQLRKYNPTLLVGVSDEQAAVQLEAEYRRQVEQSIRKVFAEQKRDKELVVRIGEQ